MATFKIGKMLMRSLFGKPATLMYPVKPAKITDATRGHMTIDIDKCVFCSLCAKKCPTNALTVDRKARTWEIQRMKCIQCNACAVACNKDALQMAPEYTTPSTEKIVELFQGPPKEEKPKAEKAEKVAEAPAAAEAVQAEAAAQAEEAPQAEA